MRLRPAQMSGSRKPRSPGGGDAGRGTLRRLEGLPPAAAVRACRSARLRLLALVATALSWGSGLETSLAATAPGPAFITEFLASNGAGLRDADGDRPDWIELRNTGAGPLDLGGWTLTDDAARPAKWRFPATNVAPNAYLVVFASGKDRRETGRELHTNFRLQATGGYLALYRPDGTLADAFSPGYPPQGRDISFGRASAGPTEALVPVGAPGRWRLPTAAQPGADWTGAQDPFDDAASLGWTPGATPLGYDVPGTAVGEAVEVVGQPVQPRAVNDSATGSIFVLASEGFSQRGEVTEWTFHSTTRHPITPLILRLETSGHFVVTGIGAARVSTGVGEQRYLFALQAGTARVASGYFLGWKDGRQGVNNTGVPAFDDSSAASVRWFQQHTHFAVGEDLGAGQAFGRAYSIAATVGASLRDRLETDLGTVMPGHSASVQIRLPFVAAAPLELDQLTLRVAHLDGFVAWLNGVEAARHNAPDALAFDARAMTNRPRTDALMVGEWDLTPLLGQLRAGTNLLALQGLADRPDAPEFFLQPELRARRRPETGFRFFGVPTPGAPNGAGFEGWVADVAVTPSRRITLAPVDVFLGCPTAGAVIRYTTDRRRPDAAGGTEYGGPLRFTNTTVLRAAAFLPGFIPSAVATHTYLFLEAVAHQPAQPAGLPAVWGGARADYGMDPGVAAGAVPEHRLTNALAALPSLCLTADPADLFGAERGIYHHSGQAGPAWEREAAVEWILPDGREGFQVDAGVRVAGDYSSGHTATLKHSLRLTFKSRIGPGRLDFPLFPDSAVTAFDQLALRACSTDSWPIEDAPNRSGDGSERWSRVHATYLRDQWMRDALRDLGQPTAHGRYVHLYLNGLYWGVYNLAERLNDDWNEAHFGGEKSEYDVLKDYAELEAGDRRAWDELMALATQGFAGEAEYQRLQGNWPDGTRNPTYPVYLDVGNFIDYMIVHIHAGAEDWPVHNWWASRRRGPSSEGFRFYVWDQEISNDRLSRTVTLWGQRFEEVNAPNSPAILYDRLRRNSSFRQRFRERLQELLFGNGALTPEACSARWRARQAEIDLAIIAESARWGDARRQPPYTRDGDWLKEMSWQRDRYWPENHPVAIERFRRVGLFPSVDPPASDRDGDGLPDAWEVAHGLSPDDPADAALDADVDGAGNGEEWQAGTDPNDPHSRLELVVQRAETGVVLSFTAMAGRAYTVQWSPRIGPASWSDRFALAAAPTNRIESLVAEPSADIRFYRVRTTANP